MNELNNYENGKVKKILVYGMTSNYGGIESYLMTYFRVLAEKNIIFDFVSEYEKIAYADEIQQLGGKIYRIPSRRENLIGHMKAVRKILKSNKEYDSMYFNLLSASETFTVLGAVGVKNVRKIVHSHNDSVRTIGRHKALRPILTYFSDVKLACSDGAASFMFGKKSVWKNEVKIINNAIEVEKYRYNPQVRKQVREELQMDDSTFVVGHVGRICYQKNSMFLIDIFARVHEKDKSAKLLFVGEGEERENVEKAIKKYNLEKDVLLLGMRSDVERLMQAMDVFLLPSRFEGFGIVLLEAQAAGMKAIASKKLVPEITNVAGGVSFIDLSDNAEEWAEEVLKYRCAERKEYCKKLCEAGYSIESVSDVLEKILKGIC